MYQNKIPYYIVKLIIKEKKSITLKYLIEYNSLKENWKKSEEKDEIYMFDPYFTGNDFFEDNNGFSLIFKLDKNTFLRKDLVEEEKPPFVIKIQNVEMEMQTKEDINKLNELIKEDKLTTKDVTKVIKSFPKPNYNYQDAKKKLEEFNKIVETK